MAKSDNIPVGALVDVYVNGGRGITLAHVMAYHDEDHLVIVKHGCGGNLDDMEHEVIPISDVVEGSW